MTEKTKQILLFLKYLAISFAGAGMAALLWGMASVGGLPSLLGAFVALPLLMVGLSLGMGALIVACSAAALVVYQHSTVIVGLEPQLVLYTMAMFLLQVALPVIILNWMVIAHKSAPGGTKVWHPLGSILSWLSIIGVVVIGSMALLSYYMLGEGLAAAIAKSLAERAPALLEMARSQEGVFSEYQIMQMLDFLTKFLPSLLVITVWLSVIVNAIIAQYILSVFKINLRPSPRMADVYAPTWIVVVMGIIGVIALFAKGEVGFMATNLTIVLSLPLLFAGLGVVHAYAATKKLGRWLLIIFYIINSMFPIIIVATMGLGVVDEWLHIRKKFVQQPVKK